MTRSSRDLQQAQLIDKLLAEQPQQLVEGGYALRVITTVGRRTGQRRQTPLGVLQTQRQWYLVSPDAGRDWVRNLSAGAVCELAAGDARWVTRAVRVHGDEAVLVVRAYLRAVAVPWALRAFPVTADQPDEEIRAHLADMAVFRLDDKRES